MMKMAIDIDYPKELLNLHKDLPFYLKEEN